jgi:Putative lactococcus lactis phage r1t holin
VLRRIGVESAQPPKGQPVFTLVWLKDAAERALKTFAQSLLATLTLNGVDILHLDWGQALAAAATATAISLLTSVVSAGVGSKGTASLTNAAQPAAAGRHERYTHDVSRSPVTGFDIPAVMGDCHYP